MGDWDWDWDGNAGLGLGLDWDGISGMSWDGIGIRVGIRMGWKRLGLGWDRMGRDGAELGLGWHCRIGMGLREGIQGRDFGNSHQPQESSLVVEDEVGDPDHLGGDADGGDIVILGRVPAQFVVVPFLPGCTDQIHGNTPGTGTFPNPIPRDSGTAPTCFSQTLVVIIWFFSSCGLGEKKNGMSQDIPKDHPEILASRGISSGE